MSVSLNLNYAPLLATLNMDEVAQVQDLGWTVDIAPRAMRAMLAEARRHTPLETMGPLFMGITGEMTRRIELAGGAGPGAQHHPITTTANEDYFCGWQTRIQNRFPDLWFIGQWHTHPFEDVPMPSPWDIWGATLEQECGWFQWNREHFQCRGHLEIIMAQRKTRAWWVTGTPERIYLVLELDQGIAG